MKVFAANDTRPVEVWGPTAAITVTVGPLDQVVGDTWLLTNVSVGAKEIVDVRQCFKDVSYIYALGNDQSSCSITLVFAVLVGTKNCGGEDNFESLKSGLEEYSSGRISKNTNKQSITIGGFSAYGWLVGADVGNMDPARGICTGSVTFIMELPDGG